MDPRNPTSTEVGRSKGVFSPAPLKVIPKVVVVALSEVSSTLFVRLSLVHLPASSETSNVSQLAITEDR